jgi:hypothetical protein
MTWIPKSERAIEEVASGNNLRQKFGSSDVPHPRDVVEEILLDPGCI